MVLGRAVSALSAYFGGDDTEDKTQRPSEADAASTPLQVKTRRLWDTSSTPPLAAPCGPHSHEAAADMTKLLAGMDDLDGWLEKIAAAGLGKPSKFSKSWDTADELHSRFRTFCKYGRVDAVTALVHGPGRDFWCQSASYRYNETGLILACKYGHHEVVKVLVAADSEINYPANGGAALHWACKSYSQEDYAKTEPEQVAIVQYLLGEGAQMRLKQPDSEEVFDALLMAVTRGSVPMIMLLRAAGAEVTEQSEAAAKQWGGAVSRALLSEEKIAVPYTAPPYWTHQSEDPATFEQIEEGAGLLRTLQDALDRTFKGIRTRDRAGRVPQGLRLKRVMRIENSAVWARYLSAAAAVEKRRPGGCTPIQDLDGVPEHGFVRTSQVLGELTGRLKQNLAEFYLFHGTSPLGAKAISAQGFRRIMAGMNAGTAFGRGCYFAESSSKSDEYAQADDDGHFVMLLCRVVCGEMFRITDRAPLALSDALHSGRYDSVLADREASVGTYREFVVFDEECVYPEYIMLYDRVMFPHELFTSPMWSPSLKRGSHSTAMGCACGVAAKAAYSGDGHKGKTQRLPDATSPPPEAEADMKKLLAGMDDLAESLEKMAAAGFGKPPKIHTSWASAEELHSNFRTFCKYGKVEAVTELLGGGARDFWCLSGSFRFNETGLVLACKYGHHEVVRALVAAGSEIDYLANGGAALHWACKSYSQDNYARMEPQQVATVQYLLGEGAQMRVKRPNSEDIYDALLMAVSRGSVPMIMLLRAAGAEVTEQSEAAAKKWGGAVSRALLSEEKIVVPYTAPPYWTNQSEDPATFEQIAEGSADLLRNLQDALDRTFKGVRTRDRAGPVPQSLRLKSVVRIENSAIWARYLNASAALEKRRPGGCTPIQDLDGDPEHGHVRTSQALGELTGRLKQNLAEFYLFHGTSPLGAKAISAQGFRRIMAGMNAGTAFGRGCYFAESSSKSDEYAQADDDGHFVMLLCRVVCGEMFRITDRAPLALSDALHSGRYDSVLADREASVGTYREFVVFDEECVYPEYIMLYDRVM
ncbi:PARP12 [Symbiodinium natans]|uniref:Poly [ADP-ribose] polymerase n=1 Tax=Symbiodinium natans TaxID=878477 RepID=A0A812SZH8_9DINO|nr:PARP12 [Symbiodinium natans]